MSKEGNMENKRNYQKELEKILMQLPQVGNEFSDRTMSDNISPSASGSGTPTLLLHSCCAPCSSYVLEYLSNYFEITVFYYNPNIFPEEEYFKRVEEQKRLIAQMHTTYPVSFLEGRFDSREFYEAVRGLEQIPEGGSRCHACFRLRLKQTAKIALSQQFDYFTTTLTISPLKNAAILNEIGEELAREYQVCWLPSDFKKKNGYKRSIELSAEYNLYRQDYCGCIFSKWEREQSMQAR